MTPTIELLKAHRSIRKFENRPIATDLLHELIQAGQAAASSSFLQAATIIRISDPAKRASLAAWPIINLILNRQLNFWCFAPI